MKSMTIYLKREGFDYVSSDGTDTFCLMCLQERFETKDCPNKIALIISDKPFKKSYRIEWLIRACAVYHPQSGDWIATRRIYNNLAEHMETVFKPTSGDVMYFGIRQLDLPINQQLEIIKYSFRERVYFKVRRFALWVRRLCS